MPAAVPIALAVVTAGAVASAVQANQQVQHAKGAAQAEGTLMQQQVADAQKQDQAKLRQGGDVAKANQDQAMAAIRAAMSSTGQLGNTVLSGAQGAAPAPTQGKTLLGL